MVTGPQCPHLILSTVYLLRISSLTAAFLALLHRNIEHSTDAVIQAIQITLAGQSVSTAPIVYWSMKENKWPQPDWSLILVEIAKNITLVLTWLLFTFCSILLIGAPASRLP